MSKKIPSLCCGFALATILLLTGNGTAAAAETDPAADKTSQSQTGVPVTEVEVKSQAPAQDGTAENGYRTETITSLGLWGSMKLQDTPYSITVIPRELIENVQASMPDDLFRISPFIQPGQPQTYGSQSAAMIRGFKVDNFNNVAQDGLPMGVALADLEDKERIEVLTGVSGFSYGQPSPGGMINYVTKRPTSDPLASLTVGDYGGSSYYIHGDFGGPVQKNLAYRFNVVAQDGDTSVDNQSINRQLFSGALDWHISDKALLQFDAAHHEYTINGVVPKWSFASGVNHPSAPDAEKLWSQPFGYSSETMDKLSGRLTWKLDDTFTLRTGIGYDKVTREAIQFTNTAAAAGGSYTQIATAWAPWEYTFNTHYVALDSKFRTGAVAHTMTFGVFTRTLDLREHQDNADRESLTGNFTFDNPLYVTEPSFSTGVKPMAASSSTRYKNLTVGDNMQFNDKLSLLAGLSHAEITSTSWDRDTGAVSKVYNKNRTVPAVSLIYKPDPALTTYATFAEGLERGSNPGSGSINFNEVMPPMLSKQYELGAKTTIGRTLFTAALFQIDKAYGYLDTDSYWKQDGREIHKGLELSATGKITDNLTLVGGLTFLRPTVNGNPAFEGKLPADVAKRLAKLYAEYTVDRVPGLTLTGGIYYTGRQAADAMNTEFLPGVTTFDLGARYQTTLNGTPVTYRLNVSNLFNKNYWANSSYTGYPRTIAFSAQFRL